jgi:flavin-dependent dehydrogenase
VIGGGPAGSVAAIRLAELGHRVCVVERCVFPRAHVGESLTAGIWPVIDALGLRETVQRAGFLAAGETLVRWGEPRTDPVAAHERGTGLLVDRAAFDALLLARAASAGVRIFQPAQARGAVREDGGWRVEIVAGDERRSIRADQLVDATGRNGFLPGEREQISPRTVALCGYVRDASAKRATLVEAQDDAWCWGAHVPGGLFSAMVFLDPKTLREVRPGGLEAFWRSRLARTELFAGVASLPPAGRVFARDATTYRAADPIGAAFVRVGEASFSLDPLSSTGVEKAMQTGFVAATAVHTTLAYPDRTELCERFYRDRQAETVSAHAAWSSGYYRSVERYREHPFWQARSGAGAPARSEPNDASAASRRAEPLRLTTQVRLSNAARLADEPCIVGDEIRAHAALFHPSLARPVAFVEGVDVGGLLALVPPSAELGSLLALWSTQVSPRQAQRVAAWLMHENILEAVVQPAPPTASRASISA